MTDRTTIILSAAGWGVLSSISCLAGAIIGLTKNLNRTTRAALMAFGGGALIQAVTIELFGELLHLQTKQPGGQGFQVTWCGIGLGLLGGLMFAALNKLLNGQGAFVRRLYSVRGSFQLLQRAFRRRMVARLRRVPVLEALSRQELERLVPLLEKEVWQVDQPVINRRSDKVGVYLVTGGAVRLEVYASAEPDGGADIDTEHATYILGKGAIFGDTRLLGLPPMRLRATVLAHGKCYHLPHEALVGAIGLSDDDSIDGVPPQPPATEGRTWFNWLARGFSSGMAAAAVTPVRLKPAKSYSTVPIKSISIHPAGAAKAVALADAHGESLSALGWRTEEEAAELGLLNGAGGGRRRPSRDSGGGSFVSVSRVLSFASSSREKPRRSAFDQPVSSFAGLAGALNDAAPGPSLAEAVVVADYVAEGGDLSLLNPDLHEELKEQTSGKMAAIVIWLGMCMDGVPESLVIGFLSNDIPESYPSLVGFVMAVALANFPEAMSSSAIMRAGGMKIRTILSMWCVLVVGTGIGATVGAAAFPPATDLAGELVNAYAHASIVGLCGGATIAMVSSTLIPEAVEQGGQIVGLSTLSGFLVAMVVKAVGTHLEASAANSTAH